MVFSTYLEKTRVNSIKFIEELLSLRRIKMATQEEVFITEHIGLIVSSKPCLNHVYVNLDDSIVVSDV